MEKLKYFNTPKGQIYLRRARLKSWFHVKIDQEPSSKSIKKFDAIYFQRKVLEALKLRHKRAYSSPLVLQIDFYTSQKNPPSIHNLAKNYLDLLKYPVPGSKIKNRRILYNDDRQIKLLIVNYCLGGGQGVHIEVETLRNFICDLDLIRRIEMSDFEESDDFDYYDLTYFHKEIDGSGDNDLDIDDGFGSDDLRELEAEKNDYVKRGRLKFYLTYKDMIIRDIQRSYLKSRQITINSLLSIFPSYYLKEKSKVTGVKIFDDIAGIGRNLVGTLGIRLPNKPTKRGGSSEFKKEIKVILEDFKRKFNELFPLKSVLGLTILFLPPKNQGIDLDNLARKYIVPFVNDIVRPPRNYADTIDMENMEDGFLKKHLLDELNKLPKEPQYSITQYQIIEMPRLEQDSSEGYIRLLFNDGGYESNLWAKVKNILDEWEDAVDYH